MIDRYCTPEMTAVWSRQAKYERWMEVELAICQAYASAGVIPQSDMAAIKKHSSFTLERCDEIEKETRHDLMAFVRCMSENIIQGGGFEPETSPSRWVHFGVTSYDCIDTALAMLMRDGLGVLLVSLADLKNAVHKLWTEHGDAPCIGRTHGIHAEPITFGHKCEGWWHELSRSEERLKAAQKEISVGKVSGAVGIHAHVNRDLEAAICASLGLEADPSSTQIVARDRHAHVLTTMAVMAGSLERVATELRNLQRTEILEVQEEFTAGQTGSSAMPHKRNPWNSETVCGLARVVRGNCQAMLESVMTWHERDLTNSSLERVVLPDTFQLCDFMIRRLVKILSGLVIMRENMTRNLRLMGDLVFSEHVMVALIHRGVAREKAYKIAQRNAAKAWEGTDFQSAVRADEDVQKHLSSAEIDELFSLEHHLRNAPKPPAL
jgi:adenylosuccinate lyase